VALRPRLSPGVLFRGGSLDNTPETGGKHTGTIGVSGTINGFPVGTGSQIVNRWIAVRQQHPRKGGIGHFSKNDWFGAEGGNVSFCQGKQK
jgi:hypothetical protein